MNKNIHIMEEKNAELIYEFDMYVIEHPEFAEKIPQGAIVVMQIEDDKEFNPWSKKLAKSQAEKGQPIIYIWIKELLPTHSRIKKLKLERVA